MFLSFFTGLWIYQSLVVELECNSILSKNNPTVVQLYSATSEENNGVTCENDFSSEFCQNIVDVGSCPDVYEDSPLKNGCRKSCGFCQDENDNGESKRASNLNDNAASNGGCEDKIPNCSSYLSMCCSMKDAMNASCAKTCKFCSESPATVPPSAPGAPGGVVAPTAATDQDPCDPTNPPSVTVDTPGQTTTTQASVTGFPGISIDSSLPGQTTTTTTQASITGPGSIPGNPMERGCC